MRGDSEDVGVEGRDGGLGMIIEGKISACQPADRWWSTSLVSSSQLCPDKVSMSAVII